MRARILALAAVLVLLGPVTAFAAVGLPCAAPDDCCCAHQAAARSERAADGAAVDHAARFQRACCCEVRGDDAAPSPSSTPAIAGDHGHDAAIVAVVVPVAWIAQAPRARLVTPRARPRAPPPGAASLLRQHTALIC